MPRTDTASPTWDVAAAQPNTVQIGVWTQLTATYNATSGMMNLAVHGTTVATATHTTTWNATGAFWVGAGKTGTSTYGNYLSGQVANLHTWTQVLDLTGASRTLMGDTRADIIRKSNGTLLGYFNGDLTPTMSVKWDNAPGGYTIGTGFNLSDSAIQFADLNGDGFRDLIRKSANGDLHTKYNPGVPLNETATWVDTTPWYAIGSGWTIPDSAVRFADLNGDGRDDIVKKLNGTLEAYYNLGVNGSNGINWDQETSTTGYVIGWGWTMPDSALYFADLTGEGRAEVINKARGTLTAYYNGGINANKTVAWYSATAITPDWSAYPDSSIYIG